MAIRYDKKLNAEIRRVVNNFNAKVRRLEKEGRELLPQKVSVEDFKKSVISRKEIRNSLKDLQTFLEKGSEDIVTTKGGARVSNYQLKVAKRNIRTAKLNYTKQLNKYGKIKPRGSNYTLQQMGDETISNIRAKLTKLNAGNIELMNQQEFKKMSDFAKIQMWNISRRNYIFWNSYLDVFDKAVYMGALDGDKAKYIKDKLMTMDANKFYEMYKSDPNFKSITVGYIEAMLNGGQLSETLPDNASPTELSEKQKLTNAFDELYENIDELVEKYK